MYDNLVNRLTFNKDNHIPAIIQDHESKRVLTLCYMTKEALEKTLQEGYVYVFRRSLNKLMKKGESSGHVQQVQTVALDCDGKSLCINIKQHVAGCHKGYFSCYFEEFNSSKDDFEIKEKIVFDPDSVYK
ncbi:MAG: phosphoribosyl-ATP pyrophosphohydrolase/phosphoribosyl-AMP cyclohydrolase [Candidatus Omnitrophota bacterium]|jgi:phosphoribosyl-ATP pyrophosphohydrolase/phosphoribosyl-AMP cyclohydrolase